MNKKILFGGLLLIVPTLLLFAMSFGKDTRTVRSPLVGREAPPFTLRTLEDGSAFSLAQLKGKPAVVNFWATWCEPCKVEHGVLTSAARRHEDVQFVGIVYDDEKPHIEAFLDTYGRGYPVLIDDGGKAAIAYGVTGIPETFFLDAEGKVVSKYMGPIDTQTLEARIAELQQAPLHGEAP